MSTTAESGELPAFVDSGVPDNIQNSQLFHDYLERLADGRDMRVLIDAEGNETGVGKTMLGSQLATLFDIHGFDATKKATMNVREYIDIYGRLPGGSCCYLQEAEKSGDKRRSMSKDVMSLGYTFAILRTRQIFGILDLPDVMQLDDRIIKSCDYRILVKDRGEALVFRIDNNDFTKEKYFVPTEEIYWPDLDPGENYRELSRQKQDWIQGEAQEKYVHIDEFNKAKKNFYDKFTRKTRYECMRGIWSLLDEKGLTGRGGEISQAELGAALGRENEELELKQSMVSKILKAENFEEIYNNS